MKCRHCAADLRITFVDLGSAPPSNRYLSRADLRGPEKWYPLRLLVCGRCWLVQTEDFADREELFPADYAYFSSYSSTWLQHARDYVDAIVNRFGLNERSKVVEVGCNDGYLLQYVAERGIPCLGLEPTASTASSARAKGIEVVQEFFGRALAARLAAEGRAADLIIANNVLGHVPDINDFVAGVAQLLEPGGVATFEFPHLLRLVDETQFDTIYHEHFSYLSLTAVVRIFEYNGLAVFDVDELTTHGGSLRVYADALASGGHAPASRVAAILAREHSAGIAMFRYYEGFQARVERLKNDFLRFLLDARNSGKKVVAYGAAAKGNTFLNYSGIRGDLVNYVVDRNPAKQGKYLPGSRIPIVSEGRLRRDKPDYVIVLPWNLKEEVSEQLAYVREWGAALVTTVPLLKVS